MNATLDVLAGWSVYGYAMLTDLSSAYRSVRTKAKTNSLRRFFWFSDPNDPSSMIEIMVVRMNFGDKPAGRVLDLCNLRISEDPGICKETSAFLKVGTYVDDGATSSQSRRTIEKIANELGPLYQKYSFSLKYCLKSYLPTEGHKIEEILGLSWDVESDSLLPHLDIFLSSKKRGLYTDSRLSVESITAAVVTQRLVLRIVGQMYDLSGRHLCPLLIAGRLTYGVIVKLRLGWDGICEDELVNSLVRKFLLELLDVTQNLKPMPRAWVPAGYRFTKVLCPIDGGDGAYAAHGYVRSELPPETCGQVVTTPDTVESESGKFVHVWQWLVVRSAISLYQTTSRPASFWAHV